MKMPPRVLFCREYRTIDNSKYNTVQSFVQPKGGFQAEKRTTAGSTDVQSHHNC